MFHNIKSKIPAVIRDNFRFSTLSFLFIIAYVNLFQFFFGPENSIAGVIFTIMMSASMARDLTAAPIRHLLVQSFVLVWMALSAFLVSILPGPLSFCLNFVTLFGILYAYTFEHSNHIYFPYILSYLFLIFISPITAVQLPKRLMGMLAGALSIMLYQWFMGRKRAAETAREVLCEMIDETCSLITLQLSCETPPPPSAVRKGIYRLNRTVYDRRKKVLGISDAGFAMICAGNGLDQLQQLIRSFPVKLSEQELILLSRTNSMLLKFRAFIQMETEDLPDFGQFSCPEGENASQVCRILGFIRESLGQMTSLHKKLPHSRRSAFSLKLRLAAVLDISPVRVIYALRTALILACAAALVQALDLPHGKWLLFTLASVSLPYSDDVPDKIKKRIQATLAGGLVSVAVYSLIPSAAGRSAIMMLSGYLSFYFTDYKETFACSTIGALGGAVLMNSFGFTAVGNVFLIRMAYILAGAAAAWCMNCLLFPYTRARATASLWRKYKSITALLADRHCRQESDPQLLYSLVIQSILLEEKLSENVDREQWSGFSEALARYRDKSLEITS